MGSLAINIKILRCEKCFMLKKFLIEPNYPGTSVLSECDCGFSRVPVLTFTNALKNPEIFIIRCSFCKKEAKNTLYCTGCRRTYCNTCKNNHDTKKKTKTSHHMIDSFKYDFYCAEHQDDINNAYCMNCSLNICQKCINTKKHNGHIIIMYNKIYLRKSDEENLRKNFELSEEKIGNKINMSKVLLSKIEDKEKNNSFKEVVNTSIKNNRAILVLIKYFYQMYTRAKHKNYAIIYNITENIKFNQQPFSLFQTTTLEERIKDFTEYLKTDFVLFKRYISTKVKNNIIILHKKESENKNDAKTKEKKEIKEEIIKNNKNIQNNQEKKEDNIDNNENNVIEEEKEENKNVNISEENKDMINLNIDIKIDENNEKKNEDNNEIKNEENNEIKIEENNEKKIEENNEIKIEEKNEIKNEDNNEIKNVENNEIKNEDKSEVNNEMKKEEINEIKNEYNNEIKIEENCEIKIDINNISENNDVKKDIIENDNDSNHNENYNIQKEIINNKIDKVNNNIIDINKDNNIKDNKKRVSIFDINEIINEKYDDDIFKEEDEEIDFDIKTFKKNTDNSSNKNIKIINESNEENFDKKLIMSNISEEPKKIEDRKISVNNNSESDFDVTFNPSAVKHENINPNKLESDKELNNLYKQLDSLDIIIEKDKEKENTNQKEEDKIINKIEEDNNTLKPKISEEDKQEEKIKENQSDDKINIINDNNEENNKSDKIISEEKINDNININVENINEKNNDEKKNEQMEKEENKENKEEIKKEVLEKEIKDEKKEDIIVIEEKKEDKKEEKKEEKKEDKKEEKKEDKKEEKKEEKKEAKKEEKKEITLNKIKGEPKKIDAQKLQMFTSNKNEIKKEKYEIITKSSNLASRKAMFEKKSNISHANTLQENPPIKKIYNPNILNNPKFSNVVRVMSDKITSAPATKSVNTNTKPLNIIVEKENPNNLIMNKPTVSKNTIKKKPKKIDFLERIKKFEG